MVEGTSRSQTRGHCLSAAVSRLPLLPQACALTRLQYHCLPSAFSTYHSSATAGAWSTKCHWLAFTGVLNQNATQTHDACDVTAGFADPFDVRRDVTLDNPKYRLLGWPLMAGKLDWVLLRRLRVRHKEMRNLDYAASDHRLLLVDGVLD